VDDRKRLNTCRRRGGKSEEKRKRRRRRRRRKEGSDLCHSARERERCGAMSGTVL
jgi:hypothetical protein